MANKKKFAGILAIMLVFGMLAAGCGDDDPKGDDPGNGNANTDPKSITITGITGITGEAEIAIFNEEDEFVAYGEGSIANHSVTIALYDDNENPWTGNGSFFIMLGFYDKAFIYTNGKSFAELGITESTSEDEIINKIPKYNISSASSTIAFNQFIELQ